LKENKNLKILIILFLTILAVLIAGLAGRGITLFNVADFIFIKPVSGIASYLNRTSSHIYGLYGIVKNKIQLENENARLKEKVNTLEERIKLIQGVYEENERLHDILNIKNRYTFQFIISKVISSSKGGFNLLIIDKGKKDGIKKMMPVVCTYDGKTVNLVGIVIDTSHNFAKVLISTDPNFNVGAKDIQTGETGIAKGNGKNLSIISKILLPKIKNNDLIVTTGISDIYPENIIIGKIVDIKKKNSITTEAVIKPSVDFDTLSEVMIIYKK